MNLFSFSRNRRTFFYSLKILDIGRDKINRKIIHCFIEVNMRSDLDTFGINIIPKTIPSGVGNKTQENTFLGISFELSLVLGSRSDPDSATKSSKNRNIIVLARRRESFTSIS